MSDSTTSSCSIHQPQRGGMRRGMTLMELMLVLALLVMMGALMIPTLREPFENQRLRKSGDVVRIAWNRARIKAMKTGQVQMFRYTAEEGTYSTQPYYSDQDVLEADLQRSGGLTTGTSGTAVAAAQQQDAAEAQPKQLPEGVVFVSGEVQTDTRSYQLQQEMQTQPSTSMPFDAAMGGAQEFPPILFYPDGTTSDARLVLTNQHRIYYVVVSLRSLTGVAKVSDLVVADQVSTVP